MKMLFSMNVETLYVFFLSSVWPMAELIVRHFTINIQGLLQTNKTSCLYCRGRTMAYYTVSGCEVKLFTKINMNVCKQTLRIEFFAYGTYEHLFHLPF